eukprot:GHVL01011618.1.p1 GENE.GHVL01011618.1~~GHVL01011618.1.p1  ORF type:complete len:184 (-),score=44.36 GHVL01011618.1:493-1044(-)
MTDYLSSADAVEALANLLNVDCEAQSTNKEAKLSNPLMPVVTKKPFESKIKEDGEIWKKSDFAKGPLRQTGPELEEPQYEILFRQAVGTHDVFLGMSEKNPSSDSCEEFLIKIYLPDTEEFSKIILDVTKEQLFVKTIGYTLRLNLPQPVKSEINSGGSAKWDKEKQTLLVVLPIDKDLFPQL